MHKRIYGIIGIKSKMANWNADFTGYPKTTSNGDVFGSDKALKYPMKKQWDMEGKKVLYTKSFKVVNAKNETLVSPRSLKERYEYLYDVADLKKESEQTTVVKNLFMATDVKQFGATFAEEGNNIGITGAVQIGQGFNKYDDSTAEEQQILSPFRDGTDTKKNKNGEEAKSTSLGSKIVSDEAHYIYPFAITPGVYKEYVNLGLTDGYTEDDYKDFKEVALTSTTAFNTNSKLGCENEIAVFVEVEEDTYLPDLSQYVYFTKGKNDEKDKIVLGFGELLNDMKNCVKNVEVYYNPYTTILEHSINNAKIYNLFTKAEIK